MKAAFNNVYEDLTVLVTGHTGFKGSWLSIWLKQLGANVIGYSLNPPTNPSNFDLCSLQTEITHVHGDIRDYLKLRQTVEKYRPHIIFHLAAQAIVIDSYMNPRETFEVNAQGTVNLLEIVRETGTTKAMVIVTTDKCYENKEWVWGYRENDPLGGKDPYSASKAMAELAVQSYRASFFQHKGSAIASARAGNVIGGGDFASFRIIADAMKALIEEKPILVRSPESIRPWLHVLDPLSGYLWLGANLLEKGHQAAQAWNFGPQEQEGISVRKLVDKAIQLWGKGEWKPVSQAVDKPEMNRLRLCWDKAAQELEWAPVYNWEEALEETVDWFKAFKAGKKMYAICKEHIEKYVEKGNQRNLSWAKTMEKETCGIHPLP